MRVSSNKDDKGFAQVSAALANGKSVHVFLDGVEQMHCDMADDELGQVRRCVLDADGYIQVHPETPDMIWTEVVTGEVEIRFKDAA